MIRIAFGSPAELHRVAGLALLAFALLGVALPCHASRWVELGNAGVTTDKVMLDADSIETVDAFRTVDIMTLYSAPRENSHHITMDRHLQKTGFDCAAHKFAAIRTVGYLGDKQVGASPENADWKTNMRPVSDNLMDKRAFAAVCGTAPNGPATGKPKLSTGSGIVVDASGDILTANHVIAHCKSITVQTSSSRALEARVAGVDPKNDLALLKTAYDAPIGEPAHFRATSHPAKVGETIGVTGYPLNGYLSTEPKATFGQVNSVAGVNNDYTLLQISAPVQPGNSGGPVLDASGQVLGVVVSEVPLAVVALTGALPQNVNFAIRGEVAQIFLAARGINIAIGGHAHTLSTEDIAAEGLKSTVLVQCTAE
jgi:S1-C subfamily serine protease